MKVLIIEDDPIILKMYGEKFTKEGFDTLTTETGSQGLYEAEKEVPDLILLDLMMPNIDGVEVLNRLKENPITRNIPVAIITVVPEELASDVSGELFKKVVAYWRKDNNDPAQIVAWAKDYLSKHSK